MREKFHDALRYWGILMALYYGLLFLAVLLVPAEGAAIAMMVLLLFVQPIGTVACAVRHGLRCGFWAVFFLGAMFLMLPALFLFYGLNGAGVFVRRAGRDRGLDRRFCAPQTDGKMNL